jgi:hypothetical protein
MRILALVLAALALTAAPAAAQSLALRAPAWAQPLLAADAVPTLGGRAALAADGIVTAVRVTISPQGGGVARVIRFDARADGAEIALRRFTGHPNTGWWLWGPDTPYVFTPTAAQAQEIANMARALSGVAGVVGAAPATCESGVQAFIEIAVNGRATSLARPCATSADAAGRLVLRLSEIAGSRDNEELDAAAARELIAADSAFAAKARADGVAAAFAHYAAEGAVTSPWPQGARLEWAPESARVSSRGDMGWTTGAATIIAATGARTQRRYVRIWRRDFEGNWRYAFDAPVQ